MNLVTSTLPPGFRDMPPTTFLQRRHILCHLQHTFELHGFLPLATPAMEHLHNLMGNYGTEGDQLLFKVLNSGNFTSKLTPEALLDAPNRTLWKISKKGLRYDLTLPLARYVATHKHNLHFPFKRYQIQPVWRADRPQKGRYREFYQCDIDVVGSSSLFYEATLLLIAHDVLHTLDITNFTIHINHRQLLTALACHLGMQKEEIFFFQTLDKLGKIGKSAFIELLTSRGLTKGKEVFLELFFAPTTTLDNTLDSLRNQLSAQPGAQGALDDLAQIIHYVNTYNPRAYKSLSVTPTLARGLSYYTGPIFEISVANTQIGSIVGGGRYDDLTTIFGLPNTPSVGLSFGLERIHDIMLERNLFPADVACTTQVLLVPMEANIEPTAIRYLLQLHQRQIPAEIYPVGPRMKKIFTYAHKKKIPWVAIVGLQEFATDTLSLKNMHTGQQKLCTFAMLQELISVPTL